MSNPSEVKNKLNLIFIFTSTSEAPTFQFFLYKHQDMCWREGKPIAVDVLEAGGTQKEVIFIHSYIPTHNRKYNNIKSTVMKSFPLKEFFLNTLITSVIAENHQVMALKTN